MFWKKDPVKKLEKEIKKMKKEIERLLTERARIRDLGVKAAAGLPIPGVMSPAQVQDRLDTLRRLTVQKNYLAYQARLKQIETEIDQEIQKLEKDVAKMEQKLQEPLTLTSPRAGQVVKRGELLNIEWRATGPIGDRLRIGLLKNGVLVKDISFGTPTDIGKFSWEVPEDIPSDKDYQISLYDPSSGLSTTSGTFQIQ